MARRVRDYQSDASKIKNVRDVMAGGGRQILPRGTGTMSAHQSGHLGTRRKKMRIK